VARLLGVCPSTIKNRIASGEIMARKRGGRWVVSLVALQALSECFGSLLLKKNLEIARNAKSKGARTYSGTEDNEGM
jgi:hypothetical protein